MIARKQTYQLKMVFLAAIALLALVLLGTILVFVLPRPHYEWIGPMQAYPASTQPYDLRSTQGLFLVNTGDELIAFNPNAPRRAGCRVYWDADRSRFSDPCFGTVFDLQGKYLDGPPSSALSRYPVRIEDQDIWVGVEGYR